jgi:AcrR family transcriptional regulator
MAYNKLLSPKEILSVAVRMVEEGEADGLSLRAIAGKLGVKAPSLYRYFPDKSALELAVAVETLRRMHAQVASAAALPNPNRNAAPDPKVSVIAIADTYVKFARKHYALYAWIFAGRVQQAYGSSEGKALWNVLLEAVSNVTGKPDDTASTVALWAFLHGYATLEQAGGFGASGPKGAFEVGLSTFLASAESRPAKSATKKPNQGTRQAKSKKPVKP